MTAPDADLRAALARYAEGLTTNNNLGGRARAQVQRDLRALLAEHQPTAREAECTCRVRRVSDKSFDREDDPECPIHAQPAPVAPAGEVPSDVTDLAARLGVDPREIVRWPWSTASPGWYVRTETVEGLLYAAEQRLAVLEEIHGSEILDHADTKDALAAAEHRVDEAQAATWVGWELKVQELTDRAELAEQRLAAVRALADEFESLGADLDGEKAFIASDNVRSCATRLRAALVEPAPVLAQVKAEAESVGAQFLAQHEGTCPKCGEHKFIGHGPLCLDCIRGGDDGRA